jgi:hypothetical protein
MPAEHRHLLLRIINPGVPWYVAVVCTIVAGVALLLLALNPHDLTPALVLLVPAAALLYGTALVRWLCNRRKI